MKETFKLVRSAYHAGSWYTANRAQLDAELVANLEKAEATLSTG